MSFLKVSRKIILGLIAIALASYGLRLFAQQRPGGLTPPPKPSGQDGASARGTSPASGGAPFVVGERLIYNVSWAHFPTAARIEMEVAERGLFFGSEGYQIRARVETLGEIRSLFGEIDHQYNSYVSPQTALPYRLTSAIRQGQGQIDQVTLFDQPRKVATFTDESTLPLTGDTYDLVSLAYGLRLRTLSAGQKLPLTALYGKQLIQVEAEIKGHERIQTQAGAYNTICVRLSPRGKLSKYRVTVWLSDDAQRLPVLITSRLPFGEPRAELASVSVNVRSSAPLANLDLPRDESGSMSLPGPASGGAGRPGAVPGKGGAPGTGDPNAAGQAEDRNLPFAVGERLNYDIAWGNFASVGTASFEVRRQGMIGQNRVFEFFGEAASSGVARSLITVSDQMSSFAMVDSLLPIRTDIRLREGRRFKQTTANYDWGKNRVFLSSGSQTEIQSGTGDLLSLFYAVRAADLKIGASNKYLFLDANHRPQMVVVRVVKDETINSAIGTRNTLQLDILAPEPARLLLAQVWVSNDSRRLPMYLVTRTRFGEIRFQLTNAVNTK